MKMVAFCKRKFFYIKEHACMLEWEPEKQNKIKKKKHLGHVSTGHVIIMHYFFLPIFDESFSNINNNMIIL